MAEMVEKNELSYEKQLFIEEKFPPSSHIRIVWTTSKVTENDDPVLAKVYAYCKKVLSMHYFENFDGSIGTAFFCVMKDDWIPPTPQQSQENIQKALESE